MLMRAAPQARSLRNHLLSGAFLFAGAGLGALSAFGLQVFLARQLGVAEYGYFSSFYSVALIVSPLAGFGVGPFLLRCYGREGGSAARWSAPVRAYISLSVVLALALPFVFTINGDYSLLFRVYVGSVILVVLALEVVAVKAQLEGAYGRLSLLQCAPHLARLGCVLLVYLMFGDAFDVGMSALAIFLSSVLFYLLIGRDFIRALMGRIDLLAGRQIDRSSNLARPSLLAVSKGAWPFGAASFLFLAYFQASIAYADFFIGPEAAGLVAICITLLTATYLVPVVIYQKALAPKINHWVFHDRARLKSVYISGAKLMALLGGGIAVFIYLLSDIVVQLLFGADYEQAVPLLQILALAVPARFIGASFGAFFLLEKEVLLKVVILLLVVVVNFCAAWLFHARFGVYAMVYALLVSEWLVAILFFFASRRFLSERTS